MTDVFVYGTLKRGGSNHHFLSGQQFAAEARTPPGFTLYFISDYPGMVRDQHDACGVIGELWSVDDDCLRRLDELEGLSEKLYQRVTIDLLEPVVPRPVQTYLYLRSIAGRPHLGTTFPV